MDQSLFPEKWSGSAPVRSDSEVHLEGWATFLWAKAVFKGLHTISWWENITVGLERKPRAGTFGKGFKGKDWSERLGEFWPSASFIFFPLLLTTFCNWMKDHQKKLHGSGDTWASSEGGQDIDKYKRAERTLLWGAVDFQWSRDSGDIEKTQLLEIRVGEYKEIWEEKHEEVGWSQIFTSKSLRGNNVFLGPFVLSTSMIMLLPIYYHFKVSYYIWDKINTPSHCL